MAEERPTRTRSGQRDSSLPVLPQKEKYRLTQKAEDKLRTRKGQRDSSLPFLPQKEYRLRRQSKDKE